MPCVAGTLYTDLDEFDLAVDDRLMNPFRLRVRPCHLNDARAEYSDGVILRSSHISLESMKIVAGRNA